MLVVWILDSTAVFCQGGTQTCLAYRVECNLKWHAKRGYVQGWIGTQSVELSISHVTGGAWILNGVIVSNLENCIDLDLGFTPATNLVPLRRLALRDGQAADVSAAWLDVSAGTLEVLPQHYERRAETKYWYEAPSLDYAAMLEVNHIGFIRRYPGLWEAEM